VVNEDNELYILGTTSSADFPIPSSAFQTTFMGGTNVNGAGYSYSTGSDIFVAKLSANADQLLGSTYVGGSANDGMGTGTELDFNYGDRFRGEIVVDDEGNAYVASNTSSSDFPIVNGYSTNGIGALSGVVFKLSPNLDDLIWSTFSGGSNIESAISLQLAPDNSVYFTGGTMSSNLPTSPGAYQGSNNGGVDGYIGHISADGSTLLNCTYNGTNEYDQNYFVQIDLSGDIYVVGQSIGDYPVSPDVYSNPNSGQFVHKFSADLSTSIWSTVVGSGEDGVDISPSAFLVSDCNQIYIAGWGGNLNSNGGGTEGLPITADAFQSTTDDADFYVMVLDDDAAGLVYATYFGGSESAEHVDGGTSRFDKNGTVYQAVCAGCGGNDDFPSQPGVWSDENPSNNCNLGVFKFKLSSVAAEAEIDAPDVVCPNTDFNLVNLSEGADTYLWDLGDGTFSNDEELTHSYSEPGNYQITLYASHAIGCLQPDSTVLNITIEALPDLTLEEPPLICPGEALALSASGAESYLWEPATGLSDATSATPVFTNDITTSYLVTGTNICGSDTASIEVLVGNLDVTISENQEICPGESVQLSASGGLSYSWTPPTGLSDPNIANPIATPGNDITYAVNITTADECGANLTTEIDVLPPPPELEGKTNYVSCNSQPVLLSVSGGVNYEWEPSNGLSSTTTSSPWASPLDDITYTVTSENACGSDALEITVNVNAVEVSITVDSAVCYNTPFTISASGANNYIWQPKELVTDRLAQETLVKILNPSIITVTGFDTLGCYSTESVWVNLFPREILRAGNDRIITYGDEVQIESFSQYPILWDESPHLSCTNCNHPFANPLETTIFYASIETPYGCNEVDSVKISVHGDLYVPNAFTPDGDGLNDIFKATGIDIVQFEMEIYDRWGQRVFKSEDISKGWNGSLNGNGYYCPADVYQYRIVATERYGELFEMNGMVVLIR
jgi:gliding motility-associated-like protein